MKKILIVGAGASGMMAAIAAASASGEKAEILVLEHMDRVGKKILATGNGHCNYTNSYMNTACYHGNETAFAVISRFDHEKTVAFMKELGIFPSEKNGYFYPLSNQASAVVNLLHKKCRDLGVTFITDLAVKMILKKKDGFQLLAEKTIRLDVKEKVKKNGKKKSLAGEIRKEQVSFDADAVLLACGGLAGQGLGSDGSGYELAKALGHSIIRPVPALTGIKCEESWFKECAGVRISCKVGILVEGKLTAEENGELQLTDYGISGIPVFQVSRYAARALAEGKKVQAQLSFYPEIPREEKKAFIKGRKGGALAGFFPDKLISALQNAGVKDFSEPVLCNCIEMCGFERAQVTCGGIPLSEINPKTMESKLCKKLYFCGELLDVDAICGGYNLQWAWSSGYLAGRSSAASI